MGPILSRTICTCLFIALSAAASSGYELKTQYATVIYEHEDHLRQFNDRVSLGSLSYLVRGRKSVTTEDEVRNKMDVIVERVEAVLDMFPLELRFKVVLLPSDADVQRAYRNRYGKNVDYIAFYSRREKTVFISLSDARIGVLAHEMAHMVLDHYYRTPTPMKIEEVLAQFVETHLKD